MGFVIENHVLQTCENHYMSGQTVDCGSDVNVIFLDFKKAFDSVPHCRMMKKLSGYGICSNLLR